MPNILIIPIDNRPVCYDLPILTAKQDKSWNVFIPPRELMGGLFSSADYEGIVQWTKDIVSENSIDYAIIALDTVAYGGLVASRRIEISLDNLKHRIKNFLSILSNVKILATSSIMRISNNNINEEEKTYWAEYGEAIFSYSYDYHKTGIEPQHSILDWVLDDYLSTRKRNFELNKFFLELSDNKKFDYLVISQDDTAEYGLNVKEGAILKDIIVANNLSATIKTGADEIPLSLMARCFCDFYEQNPCIMPIFSTQNGAKIISRYEDVCIEQSFLGQINISGAKACYNKDDSDFVLYLNTPVDIQDDLAMQVFQDKERTSCFEKPQGAFAVCNVQSANGAQNTFIEELFDKKSFGLMGYAGWNTTANSLGSVLSCAIIGYFANKNSCFDKNAFLKLIALRFLDDWAYQANLRQKLRKNADFNLKTAYFDYINKVEDFLGIDIFDFSFYFPWDRTFEIGLDFKIEKRR